LVDAGAYVYQYLGLPCKKVTVALGEQAGINLEKLSPVDKYEVIQLLTALDQYGKKRSVNYNVLD
jgi:hypothetical protein